MTYDEERERALFEAWAATAPLKTKTESACDFEEGPNLVARYGETYAHPTHGAWWRAWRARAIMASAESAS